MFRGSQFSGPVALEKLKSCPHKKFARTALKAIPYRLRRRGRRHSFFVLRIFFGRPSLTVSATQKPQTLMT